MQTTRTVRTAIEGSRDVHDVLGTQRAQSQLLSSDCKECFRNDIAWEYIKVLEQVFVVLGVGFDDVVHQDVFFLGVVLEVLFETLVRYKLLLELENFLLLHRLG